MLVGSSFLNSWEYWQLYHKVTFDGVNRLVRVNTGVTELDVRVEIYSAWKEWLMLDDNSKYYGAFDGTGGNPLPTAGLFIDSTFFLINDWRVITWDDGPHSITFLGNLFTDIGETPFVPVPGATYNSVVSNIVRRIQDEQTNLPQEDLDAIAAAVWQAMSVDYNGAGTFGALLATILSAVGSDSIAAAILDAALLDHVAPDTFGEEIQRKKKFLNLGTISTEI